MTIKGPPDDPDGSYARKGGKAGGQAARARQEKAWTAEEDRIIRAEYLVDSRFGWQERVCIVLHNNGFRATKGQVQRRCTQLGLSVGKKGKRKVSTQKLKDANIWANQLLQLPWEEMAEALKEWNSKP